MFGKLFNIIRIGWGAFFLASAGCVPLSKDVKEFKDELFDINKNVKSDNDHMRGDVHNVCVDIRNSYNKLAFGNG